MNAPVRLFVSPRNAVAAARLAACAGVAALLGGCVGHPFRDARVDASSPVAAEVAKAEHAGGGYPTFADIPAAPTDVRPLRMFGQSAREIDLAAAALERATAPETWTLSNTEAFAAAARSAAGPELSPSGPSDTEAFAADLRKRATPPPPPKR